MKITRINHVAINIHGVEAATHAFYTKLLGLGEVPIRLPGQPAIKLANGSFWLEKDRVQMHAIAMRSSGEPGDPTGPHVSWYVDDIDEALAELAAEGYEAKVLGEGETRIVWIVDPAGNTVEFQQDPDLAVRA